MPCWIFVMAGSSSEFRDRIKTKKWILYKRTSNRLNIRKGDKILFYLARPPRRKIIANAVLSSEVKENGEDFLVGISRIRLWKKQVSIKPFIESLEFIKNKVKWGGYMQGGIVKITDKDYELLRGKN